jgi:hypothetical protein
VADEVEAHAERIRAASGRPDAPDLAALSRELLGYVEDGSEPDAEAAGPVD